VIANPSEKKSTFPAVIPAAAMEKQGTEKQGAVNTPAVAASVAPVIVAAVAPAIAPAATVLTPVVKQPAKPMAAPVVPLPARRANSPRYYLTGDAPIVDAPSIGPKTATRFQQIGLTTVDDLVQADPTEVAAKLNTRHITKEVIQEWQAQSTLMVQVPGLRGHDAQLLVAAGVRDQAALRTSGAIGLLSAVTEVAGTSQGRSILRDSSAPDLKEVTGWITAANQTESSVELKAG